LKNRSIWIVLIFLTIIITGCLSLMEYCIKNAKWNQLLNTDNVLENFRDFEITTELYKSFKNWEADEEYSCYDFMCGFLISGETEKKDLTNIVSQFKKYKKEELDNLKSYVCAIWEDLEYFPVPDSSLNTKATVSFVDSWMAERTFGGKRSHEGTDIMANINHRGYYPVVSMTDGVVEKIGWLPQGGYRIGIRSPHGGYFYYAHLYDYAKEFQAGDEIKAGELIGFMGDSGYSEVEGTVGNFDVHLHMGIYVNLEDGTEISINSYQPLVYLQSKKLNYEFY